MTDDRSDMSTVHADAEIAESRTDAAVRTISTLAADLRALAETVPPGPAKRLLHAEPVSPGRDEAPDAAPIVVAALAAEATAGEAIARDPEPPAGRASPPIVPRVPLSGAGETRGEATVPTGEGSPAASRPRAEAARPVPDRTGPAGAGAPVPAPDAGKGGGSTVSGGGGGRGPGGSPLQRRSGDRDFREVLTKGLARCRRKLMVVALFSFWVNMLVLGVPIYLFNISDRVLTSRSIDTLVMLTVVIAGAIAGHVILDVTRRFILMRVAVEVECRLGAPVLAAAAKASQAGSSREFQTLADLQQIRNFITGPVLLTMFDAPVAPIYLLAVFLIHPDLGWIVTSTSGLLLVFALINQKITAVPFAQASAYSTRANLQADAMARNSQVINAMGMIPESVQIWGRETAESLKAQVLAQDRNIVIAGASKFTRLLTQIGMLGWGASLALDGKLTGGMMIAASIVGGRALAPIEGVIDGWRSFVTARSAFNRIKTLLLNSPLNFDRLQLPRPMGRLTVERILYVPPPNKKVVLNGLSFQLEPGESLAIVGASGTGKSTLARMLVGSISPTAGSVRLDSMDLRNWDPRQFGQSVGYLPQDVQLFPASIKANIARMQEDATDASVFEAAEIADVHELISQFAQGYETVVGMDGSPLSGGQRQRIGLARAFFGDPRLVVLDEPNSNLDTPGEVALARALTRAKSKGTTVVAITQRPTLLKSVDKIMILKDGAVQALGKRDEIIPMIVGRSPGAPGASLGPAAVTA